MDGYYLGSNIAPLKAIGNGKTFNVINDWLVEQVQGASNRSVELVAYSIKNYEDPFVTINCLFEKKYEYCNVLFLRDWEHFKRSERNNDRLKNTAEYGIGVSEFDVETFLELRAFFNKSKELLLKA